jgi:GNAT superfamily N-acetyltransferase
MIPETDEEWENMHRDIKNFFKSVSQDYNEVSSPFGGPKVLFAEVGRKPVGMIKYDLRPGCDIVEIDELNVNPAFRRMGIGFQLLDDVIQEARMYDCQRIIVTPQEGSVGFYKRMGFKGDDPEEPEEMWLDLDENCWFCDSSSRVH